MKPARLSSGLLARKGGAAPLAGAYGGTGLEPLIGLFGRGGVAPRPQHWPAAGEPPAAAVTELTSLNPALQPRPVPTRPAVEPPAGRRNAPVRLSLHLDPERYARLRILAARKGSRPQAMLREALDSVLAAGGDDCPCVRGELPCCSKSTC